MTKFAAIILTLVMSMGLSASDYTNASFYYKGYLRANVVNDLVTTHRPGVQIQQVNGVLAMRFNYAAQSTDDVKKASALFLMPVTGNFKDIVSLQHGTILSNKDAPTTSFRRYLRKGTELERHVMDGVLMASQGNIVVMADYLGYGKTRKLVEPYLVGEHYTYHCRQALVGAIALANDLRIRYSGNAFLMGYSEGGTATMFLHQSLINNPIDGTTVIGTASGAAPHDLITTGVGAIVYNVPGTVPDFARVMSALNETFLQRPNDAIFQEPYASLLPDLYDGSQTWEEVIPQLPATPYEVFQPAFVAGLADQSDMEVYMGLTLNSSKNVTTQGPVLLYHSSGDATVPSFNSLLAYQEYAATNQEIMLAPFDPVAFDFENLGDHIDQLNYETWLNTVLQFKAQVVAAPESNG